jgi:hypothetical protein
MRIDDLALEVCDLIYLDMEGYRDAGASGRHVTPSPR